MRRTLLNNLPIATTRYAMSLVWRDSPRGGEGLGDSAGGVRRKLFLQGRGDRFVAIVGCLN
jgi:hypothetical protein